MCDCVCACALTRPTRPPASSIYIAWASLINLRLLRAKQRLPTQCLCGLSFGILFVPCAPTASLIKRPTSEKSITTGP